MTDDELLAALAEVLDRRLPNSIPGADRRSA
jgi:hypothetical protein